MRAPAKTELPCAELGATRYEVGRFHRLDKVQALQACGQPRESAMSCQCSGRASMGIATVAPVEQRGWCW